MFKLQQIISLIFALICMYNNSSIGCAVVPTALATALDINLSNISLVFITVTFATMVYFFIKGSLFVPSSN